LKSYSKALGKKSGFTKILGADLVLKCRNESNDYESRVRAQISKGYGLENVGVGQIGILFTYSVVIIILLLLLFM